MIAPLPALIVSMLAAFVVWGTLEIILPVFELPRRLAELPSTAPEAQQTEMMNASATVSDNNAIFSLALLASTLGLFLTVAELFFEK